jgi:uncharacterized protein (TIGR02265 family)
MDEPLAFDTAFETLFRSVGPEIPAALGDKLRALGVDPSAKLKPAYPMGVWLHTVEAVAQHAYPTLGLTAALESTGTAFRGAFGGGLLGAAVVASGQLIGLRRTLSRMTRNIRSSNNFNYATLTETGPAEALLKTGLLPQYLPAAMGLPHPTPHFYPGAVSRDRCESESRRRAGRPDVDR